jgi:hypothetical protein
MRSRRAIKSTGPESILGELGLFVELLRVALVLPRVYCGEPDASVDLRGGVLCEGVRCKGVLCKGVLCEVVLCRGGVVAADETGSRGRELRRGGDSFGGGEEIYALRLEALVLSLSGTLPRRGDWWEGWRGGGVVALLGVVVWLVGVTARPVGAAHELGSAFRLTVTCDLFVADGFDTGEDGLEDPD